MTLTRMSPLQEINPLWDVMDRFITDSFGSRNGRAKWPHGIQALPLEVYETPDRFVVRAFAPGVRPDDLSVEYDAGALTVRARMQAPELEDGGEPLLAEVPYGEFVRQLRLPRRIDIDRAESTFEHGVLTLELPKVAEARPRRIQIGTPAGLGAGETPAGS